jgi:glutamine synthetase
LFDSVNDLLRYVEDSHVEVIDVRFCDLPGTMHHFTVPHTSLTAHELEEGLAFDGSSIRGFQAIHESDMLLLPDVTTAFIDPFRLRRTLALNFFIHDPRTMAPYSRDPRNVARKAEAQLKASGIADTAYFGPEAEFYVFDSVRYASAPNASSHHVDSVEGAWNTDREEVGGNLGSKPAYKGGYFPVAPTDHLSDLRDAMTFRLIGAGLKVERAHHEVGGAGQSEISVKYSTLLHAADNLMLFKYIVRNEARAHGRTATFMPKPILGDNGSGMHTHQSLWSDGEPLFHDERGYGGLSDTARWYIGGLLHHAPSLLAFTNPTVNSYRRLVPGFEAPVNLVYSQGNRSACTRIPLTGNNPAAKRIEFRVPDPSCNPYLAFAAMLLAGLDGIRSRIEPPLPIDKDLYELPPDELAEVTQVPASLDAVLDALEADREYLVRDGVFTEDLVRTWISYKRAHEVDPVRLRPTPYEFELYFDV